MKKVVFILALLVSMSGALSAQSGRNAIGLRFGNGGEISFQSALGNANRLELDLGLNSWSNNYGYSGFGLSGIYQWVWKLNELAPGFKWYLGLGPQLGSWYGDYNSYYHGFALGLAGQIGVEFNLNIPLQFSLDYRPSWYILPNSYGGAYDGIALGIRYKF
ncbi:MAG: hypothetical protein P4L34_05315 [Paludibacter sp.]|nr:hypothetical protein [Paludibacter sp.]